MSKSRVRVPPLSREVLIKVDSIEQEAESAVRRCSDGFSFNTDKAVRALRTYVIDSFDAQISYYRSLSDYLPAWDDIIKAHAVLTMAGLLPQDGMTLTSLTQTAIEEIRMELHRTIEDHRPVSATSISNTKEDAECQRATQVKAFLRDCNALSQTPLYKHHIWRAVGHTQRRQFEYWQACDEAKTNESDKTAFARILSMSPRDFVSLLKRKGIIVTD